MRETFPRPTVLSIMPKVFACLLLICLASSGSTTARAATQVGPLNLSGEINGAPYRIRVPASWNGTLLVFAHGYRDKADHPGEVDNRTAEIAPSTALEAPLLAQGYALAGTAYRDNGWAVEEGIHDVKDLTIFFRENVARPERTILWSVSMGSVVTFKSMEKFGGIYDGAFCTCAVGAGASRNWDAAAALLLAYDVAFGALPSWGTAGDVRDDIDFETEVRPKLLVEVNNPLNFGKFEFMRLVTGTPGQGINPPPPPFFYPGWLLTDMFFATEARAELERRAGGAVVQNLTHNYSLTAQEKAYLATLGVNADALLAQMNARRNISASPSARNYVERNADYNGKIKSPVLTMHTRIDGLVPVSNQSAYRDTIMVAGRGDRLFQTYTAGNQIGVVPGNIGHCDFTGPQFLTGIAAIDNWVRTGTPATSANFPAALGFLPNFTPPPYPQP